MGKPTEFDSRPSAKRARASACSAAGDNATRDIATRDIASKTAGCDDATSASGTRAGDLAVVQPKPRDPRRPQQVSRTALRPAAFVVSQS